MNLKRKALPIIYAIILANAPMFVKAQTNPTSIIQRVAPTVAKLSQQHKTGANTPVSRFADNRGSLLANQLRTKQDRNMRIYSPLAAAADGTELWGGIVYADSWAQDYWAGLSVPFGYYSFLSSGDSGFTPLYTDDEYLQPDGGAVLIGDTLHMTHDIYGYGSHILYYEAYDVRTWTLLRTQVLYDYGLSAFDLAQDPTTGLVYGEFSSSDDSQADFGTVDYATLTKNVIAKMDTAFIGLAFSPEGQLYGVNIDGNLYSIDKATGSYTRIGSTGLSLTTYRQSAAIDQLSGHMYLAAQTTDGQSGLYLIDLTTGHSQLASRFDDNQEVVGMVIRQHGVTAESPARVADAIYSFDGGSLSGTVSFTAPSTSRSGTPLSGTLTACVVANGDTIATGSCTAGQPSTISIAVPSAGAYRMELLVRNAAGLGEPQRTNISWIGYDKPYIDSTNININSATNTATVSWSTPYKGVHGGYINADELKFDVVRYPGAVKAATHIADSTFTETLPDGEQILYSYSIIPFNGTVSGDTATTEQRALGTYNTVPYSETFDTKATIGEVWTTYDANNDGVTWTWSNGRAVYNGGANFANDYLLSPQIQLSTGQVYKLSYTVRGGTGHRLQVKLGQGNDPTDRNTYKVKVKTMELPNESDTVITQNIEVESDGLYRLAFRTTSDARSQDLQLDNVTLDNGISYSAPDSVTSLNAEPAPRGGLAATITFTTPEKAINGNALSGTVDANIYRASKLIATLKGLTPGTQASYTDNTPANGFNSYTVAATNASGEGIADSVRVYVGQDLPYSVRNLKLTDNLNGTSTLTWDAPSETGHNGGYVDPSKLTYTVYLDDYTILPDTTITTTSYTTSHDTRFDQSSYWYTVHVSNIAGKGETARSNMLLAGAPYTLPYKDSFAGGAAETVWWLDFSIDSQGFRFDHTTSADNDNGCIYWAPTTAESTGAAFSGMIDISNAHRPVLGFWYYENPNLNADLSVTVSSNLKDDNEVWSTNLAQNGGNSGWRHVTVDLSPYKSTSYIVLKFFANSTQTDGNAVYLDDIEVNDVLDHNIAVELQAPKSWTAGQPTTLTATIANKGSNDETATLAVTENGNPVATLGDISVSAGSDTAIVMPYTPSTLSDGSTEITASATCNGDDDTSDNAATANISLRQSELPAPTGLAATGGAANDKPVSLSWTAPEYSGAHTVTDGFEDYNPWIVNGIGLWTTRDDDHMPSYSFQQQFPHSGTAYAFIVANPTNIGADITRDDLKGLTPHSGDQYLLAFSAVGAQSSDWLISPQLSAKAQTISFYAKAVSNQYTETFEVYADSSLIATVTASSDWTKYCYEMPEGTQHFSLHYTGNDAFGLMVDDITYSDGVTALTGYAVCRDNKQVATISATTTEWTDNDCHDGQAHSYSVIAMYNVGMSQPSTAANIVTGISNIAVQQQEGNTLYYYNMAGQRVSASHNGLVITKPENGKAKKQVKQ